MKKNLLILSTRDERGEGHGWSYIKYFENLGFNTDFICLLRGYEDTSKYIIDTLNPYNLRYLYYKFMYTMGKLLFAPFKDMRWFYKGIDYATHKDIIKRIDKNPDYIIITSYQHYLSPKSIYQLWMETKATMIFSMVDEKILSGGCAYPYRNCKGYETGCKKCPLYPYGKFIPQKIYNKKVRYFTKMPFHLIGTGYDLHKATMVPFLKDKIKHKSVGVPDIPFTMTKVEARKRFNISENDFIIMAGAVNVLNPDKGFKELVDALNIFSKNIKSERPVTLLLLGKIIPEFNIAGNIKICSPGFLDLEGLFTAYYACDIYVSPSVEDSGPFMVNYAIACGRPVIAFPVGIALDLVIKKQTGWIAELRNTQDFANGVKYFYDLIDEQMCITEELCKQHIASFRDKKWYNFMLEK